MGRCQDDDVTALAQAGRASLELGDVVLDVFEHVDVQDCVEAFIRGERVHGSAYRAHWRRQGVSRETLVELTQQLRVRLQTCPRALTSVAEETRRGAEAGADLQHVADDDMA